MRTVKEDDLLKGIKVELGEEITEDNTDILNRVDILMDGMEVYPK